MSGSDWHQVAVLSRVTGQWDMLPRCHMTMTEIELMCAQSRAVKRIITARGVTILEIKLNARSNA